MKGGEHSVRALKEQINDNQHEKEKQRMKKAIVVLVAIVAVISLASSMSMARSTYLGDVNATCGTAYDCNLCHDNSNKQAYLDSGACYFCPNDPSCTTTTPPSPICTDYDKDGFFAEPGCAQLYDCNDRNSNINPGAREIPCDGIDQDCSGADKLKGKGCRR